MGRYRVNVECSQKLPQTKSEYFTHCSYEVQAISKGVAKAMVEARAAPPLAAFSPRVKAAMVAAAMQAP